jgi:septum formation protein
LTCKTSVFFDELTNEEIEHYVDKFKPYDKAGSYGIQEWIGFIGIKKIEGCYYNVMGLPLHDIYQCMKREF